MTLPKTPTSFEHIAERTAKSISTALNKMVADLHEDDAPQAALQWVVTSLAIRQPWLMDLIMEDYDIREAYADEVARRPLSIVRAHHP